MFSQQHYNWVAKRFRENMEPYFRQAGRENMEARGVLVNMAIDFARNFQDDNEKFIPIKFLDACSPNKELYPLSELWEEE